MQIGIKHKIFISLMILLSKTWRIKINGGLPPKPGIIIFWHGFMLPVWKAFSRFKPIGVVSKSKDGEILSAFLESIGFRLIRGSSASGGSEVITEMVAAAPGNHLLITPDGAKGPIYKLKPGAFVASQRTGVPVYICSAKIKSAFHLKNSWDNFSIPLPFSRIDLSFSEPISVDSTLNKAEVTDLISEAEIKMNKMYFS